jgi:hypothetical protein
MKLIRALWLAGLALGAANADVVTTLSFLSPGTIHAGGAVTIDFGVHFTPLPATPPTSEFFDNQTGSPVSSCATDPNACTEVQFNNTASVLTLLFAEVVAGNAPGTPNFYSETTAGNFHLTLSYPNPGIWEITTAGTEQEQAFEQECVTSWNMGAAAGGPSCSTIQTFSVPGTFDAGGPPSLFVTVEPAGTATPEPSGLVPAGIGLSLLGLARLIRVLKLQPQGKLNFARRTRPHGSGVQD